jgi:hypothetical protein
LRLEALSSFAAAETFVVFAHQFLEGPGNRIAIEGKPGVGFFALGNFFVEALLQFRERRHDFFFHQSPLGTLAVAIEVAAQFARAIA